MNNKGIMEKIKGRKIRLINFCAKKSNHQPENSQVDIKQKHNYEIILHSTDELSIRFMSKIFVEPEGLFEIETEHVLTYGLDEAVTEMEVKENIIKLLSPLGSEISYLISTVIKEMIGVRIVLPPSLVFEDMDNDDKKN
ncbi:hypothetical protein [Alkalibaculum bacchi]|uniref:hypothetical protein n=1 Tax=Alkalibaculum bacchi TaxID=645887 RepID=UPI0026EE39CA|nr:hypothetical protein [Alkalibaculum bacchi]